MRIIHKALHNQDLQAEIPSPVTRSMRDIRGEAALSRQAGNHLSPGAKCCISNILNLPGFKIGMLAERIYIYKHLHLPCISQDGAGRSSH